MLRNRLYSSLAWSRVMSNSVPIASQAAFRASVFELARFFGSSRWFQMMGWERQACAKRSRSAAVNLWCEGGVEGLSGSITTASLSSGSDLILTGSSSPSTTLNTS
uniref:(northern house mosquito) hypothetical protein n=1 Tax=Culex pipiens TaxID=7175 RepID=A0A8D8NG43_CULPI